MEPGQEGAHTITGEMTLHGVTKEISFPATVRFRDGGLTLEAEFSVDRTDFGMDFGPDRVVSEVSMTVVVGQKTEPDKGPDGGAAGGDGGRRGGGRRGGGNFDPAQMFAGMDANEDGKLSGDEISDRLRERQEAMDTDGDGAISLEEWQES